MSVKLLLVFAMVIAFASALKLANHDGGYAWYTFVEPANTASPSSTWLSSFHKYAEYSWRLITLSYFFVSQRFLFTLKFIGSFLSDLSFPIFRTFGRTNHTSLLPNSLIYNAGSSVIHCRVVWQKSLLILNYNLNISCPMSVKLILVFAMMMAFASTLKLASHEGQYAWFTVNEKISKNRCTSANQCDGQRTCSQFGWCQGTPRPAKNANYRYDEAVTGNKCPTQSTDNNWANRNYYCDGKRTCSAFGWCQGTSRPWLEPTISIIHWLLGKYDFFSDFLTCWITV